MGNTNCYAYDALHRVTSTTFSGPYAANTPSRYFVYDSATVNSVAMANAKTRLAEAYTCVSPCSSKITDLGFSYTVLGQPTDVYESTTHSGGYYHVTGTYYANGAINKLSNLVGLSAITYGVDGEGRVYSASAASGQNPLASATYNTASLPTQVNLGSSDSDSYTFDPSTNRMTQYKFSVNGQSAVGTLTWNPIATLKTLAITDPFYGAGNQACSYTHDDISRIASVNCGSPWNQTFGYDAFGNISKSGTISFQPTYSYLTNRMTQIGSSTPTYDANGNVLNDTAHTYTWDANGKPITIDAVGLIYDALGRMVEQNKSSVYTEIVYSPSGSKLALMSGTTLQKAFVPLAGGSVAVYNSSGLAYYRHSDWLGSSRFASTPTRTLYFDGAYAPFGENYAQTGTTDLSFTGMNQDTVANLFDFPAREYNAIHGRWPSPDPAGISSVHFGDPQTLNRYAYARNSPLHVLDPTGMEDIDCGDGVTDCFDDGGGGGGGGDGGGDGGGGGCDPTDPTCGGDGGVCDPTVDSTCGGGGDSCDPTVDPTCGNSDGGCDADCQQQQLDEAQNDALNALNNSECAQAVDGGTGAASSAIANGGPVTIATVTTADVGSGGILATTQAGAGPFGDSLITLNTNPIVGFFNGFVPGSGFGGSETAPVILLHELGHAASFAGLPTSVVNDGMAWPLGYSNSLGNSITVSDACFPKGDGGQNQGPIDDGSTPVAAAKKARKHF